MLKEGEGGHEVVGKKLKMVTISFIHVVYSPADLIGTKGRRGGTTDKRRGGLVTR